MAEAHESRETTVSFSALLVGSAAFKTLFKDGMALVETTAAYLDGPGREEAKALSRNASLAYAAESMRLTTRLMQLASWLLLQRAVNEGEMTTTQAAQERDKVRFSAQASTLSDETRDRLPARLVELGDLSLRLQDRVLHFERLALAASMPASPAPSLIQSQFDRVSRAFSQAS